MVCNCFLESHQKKVGLFQKGHEVPKNTWVRTMARDLKNLRLYKIVTINQIGWNFTISRIDFTHSRKKANKMMMNKGGLVSYDIQ